MNEKIEILLKSHSLITATAFNLMVIIITLYIAYRSGSTGVIANKIWGFFIGEKQYFNDKLAKIEQEEHDVAKFNFRRNLKMKSTNQIETFYSFIERFDIDIKHFNGLRDYYLPHYSKIKKSTNFEIFNNFLVFAILGLFLLPLFGLIFILKPISTFDNGQLINLFTYTFFISISTLFTFSELFRKIKARKTRKVIYQKKCKYLSQRKHA